ncbi:DUF5916 domain-containing protein [Pseudofulvibacter geojedonensis]|uniref:DUF5916 domain-containing protein n=1 Tax=Pseudofulvibacter geojedonensis TaxID=1123758 RepID=A0ABW3HZB3_9FLAO
MKTLTIILTFFFAFSSIAQENISKKEYTATRINKPPKIDGVLDDEIWKAIPELGDFVMMNPEDGTPERNTHKTTAKIAYDDTAIYIAVKLYDNEPHRILRQFSQRDNLNAQFDWIGVIFNTYNNDVNETKFLVSSSGTLADATSENGRDDWSWSTVYQAEISFDDKGWNAEFKIPYAALRFPEKPEQLWGLQFFRRIQHLNETYSWNYVNRNNGYESQYVGLLKGIKNITPPVRLSFYPFTAINQEVFNGDSETTFSAGMDVKYGISDSFTLDATLIPDFGQAKFDDVSLNLGPFEQIFSENRQFFTEGTEIFNKGNLFYSRRIGGAPSTYRTVDDNLSDDEIVTDNPEDVKLLNSIKVSGRTKDGLGVGVFNSVTQKTEATIKNTSTGETRKVVTEPLANYSVLVLDQQFGNNSSISLINTNVTRNGHFRDANVSAVAFDINNKENSFNFSGQGTVSQVLDTNGDKAGFAQRFSVNRIKGRFRYGIWNDIVNKSYNINDLGVSQRTNFNNYGFRLSYENFEPTEKLNKYRINGGFGHERRLIPNVFVTNNFWVNFFAVTKNRLSFGGNINGRGQLKDYFEPRTEGRFLLRDGNIAGNIWISTDFRKKYAWEASVNVRRWFTTNQNAIFLRFEPRYRFSDNFTVIYEIENWYGNNRLGYVDKLDNDDIVIAQRDQMNLSNNITASYNFNNKQAINLSFRNFWALALYNKDDRYFKLENNGELTDINYDTDENNHNTNFNIWNLDLTYNWRFAPGSEAVLLYRQQIFNQDEFADAGLLVSFDNLFNQPIQHTFSLKIVYFLDYNNAKQWLKKSNS